ncbi:hypothetical protein RIF29_23951 [Crotalaria pallida]|uniref:Uncharacterized protein n=1 Tax=Crotalaria pallida TaxID=3830 RepID=A0AAN9ER01_CROPI
MQRPGQQPPDQHAPDQQPPDQQPPGAIRAGRLAPTASCRKKPASRRKKRRRDDASISASQTAADQGVSELGVVRSRWWCLWVEVFEIEALVWFGGVYGVTEERNVNARRAEKNGNGAIVSLASTNKRSFTSANNEDCRYKKSCSKPVQGTFLMVGMQETLKVE